MTLKITNFNWEFSMNRREILTGAPALGLASFVENGNKNDIVALEIMDAGLIAKEPPYTAFGSYEAAFAAAQSFPSDVLIISAIIGQGLVEWVRNNTGCCLGGGWVPAGRVTPEHFGDTTNVDAGPMLRAARDYLVSIGGGTIQLRDRTYILGSTETRNYWSVGSTRSGISEVEVCIALPAGVSLTGPRANRATLLRSGGEIAAIIALEEYGNGAISDINITGPGSTNNTMHGIMNFVTTDGFYVVDGMTIERVTVRNVGSYGVAHQEGGICRSILRDVETENTGSDGIDWKIRGPLGQQTPTEAVVFENITVRTFGQRIQGSSSTGMGLRGAGKIRGLHIYDIAPGQVGLQLTPGVYNIATGDFRMSARYVEVDGVYCEGRDARADNPAVAVEVFAVDRCLVSNVVAKHCILRDQLAGASPPAALHGPVWKNCLVIPPHGAEWAALINLPRTSIDIEVQSDYDWFDIRAGSATLGQTVFDLPLGAPTADYAVTRNGVTITAGFRVSGSTLILDTGIDTGETVCVVYPPARAVRVMGSYVIVRGSCDEFTPDGVSIQNAAAQDTGNMLGFVWRGYRNIDIINNPTVSGITAAGPGVSVDLRLNPKGENGRALLMRPGLLGVPTSAAGLAIGTVWSDQGTLKIVS